MPAVASGKYSPGPDTTRTSLAHWFDQGIYRIRAFESSPTVCFDAKDSAFLVFHEIDFEPPASSFTGAVDGVSERCVLGLYTFKDAGGGLITARCDQVRFLKCYPPWLLCRLLEKRL